MTRRLRLMPTIERDRRATTRQGADRADPAMNASFDKVAPGIGNKVRQGVECRFDQAFIAPVAHLDGGFAGNKPTEDSLPIARMASRFVVETAAAELIKHAEGVGEPLPPEGAIEEKGDPQIVRGVIVVGDVPAHRFGEKVAAKADMLQRQVGQRQNDTIELVANPGSPLDPVDANASRGFPSDARDTMVQNVACRRPIHQLADQSFVPALDAVEPHVPRIVHQVIVQAVLDTGVGRLRGEVAVDQRLDIIPGPFVPNRIDPGIERAGQRPTRRGRPVAQVKLARRQRITCPLIECHQRLGRLRAQMPAEMIDVGDDLTTHDNGRPFHPSRGKSEFGDKFLERIVVKVGVIVKLRRAGFVCRPRRIKPRSQDFPSEPITAFEDGQMDSAVGILLNMIRRHQTTGATPDDAYIQFSRQMRTPFDRLYSPIRRGNA